MAHLLKTMKKGGGKPKSLLDNILGGMNKMKPKLTEKEKVARERAKLIAKREAEEKAKFQAKITEDLEKFVADPEATSKEFAPMPKIQRFLVHEKAEALQLVSMSVGEEDLDRHIVVYKPGHEPPEEEETVPKNEEEDEDEESTPVEPVKPIVHKNRLEKLLKPDDKLEVLGTRKRDRRTIEEIEKDMKEAKKKKMSALGISGEEEEEIVEEVAAPPPSS